MITLLYHARTNGYVCQRIARASRGSIKAVSDRIPLPAKFKGTLVRWDSRAKVGADQTINTSESVTLSRNKRESRTKLVGLCPPTWTEINQIQYPCVIRPRRHFGGLNFHVCQTKQEAASAIKRCGFRRWYASELIKKEHEYRVFVFKGDVLKIVRRFHDDPEVVAWNIANGGRSVRVIEKHWPKDVVKVAVEAGKRIGLDLYAADIVVTKEGQPFVLELNTAPGLGRDQTIELMAEVITTHDNL